MARTSSPLVICLTNFLTVMYRCKQCNVLGTCLEATSPAAAKGMGTFENTSPTTHLGNKMVLSLSAYPSEPSRVATTRRRGLAASSPLLPLPSHRAQCLQVRLISELGRERFQGLSGVVLAAIEAPVYERLYGPPQGSKQRSDDQGGDHYCELRLLLTARERPEDHLAYRHTPEVRQPQRSGKATVDQRAVDDHVYVEEPIPKYGYTHGDGEEVESGDG